MIKALRLSRLPDRAVGSPLLGVPVQDVPDSLTQRRGSCGGLPRFQNTAHGRRDHAPQEVSPIHRAGLEREVACRDQRAQEVLLGDFREIERIRYRLLDEHHIDASGLNRCQKSQALLPSKAPGALVGDLQLLELEDSGGWEAFLGCEARRPDPKDRQRAQLIIGEHRPRPHRGDHLRGQAPGGRPLLGVLPSDHERQHLQDLAPVVQRDAGCLDLGNRGWQNQHREVEVGDVGQRRRLARWEDTSGTEAADHALPRRPQALVPKHLRPVFSERAQEQLRCGGVSKLSVVDALDHFDERVKRRGMVELRR